jgi:hypothetical protein
MEDIPQEIPEHLRDRIRAARLCAALEGLIAKVRNLQAEAESVDGWPFRCPDNGEYCQRVSSVLQAIGDTFTVWGLLAVRERFPVLQISQRYDAGYNITKADLLGYLDRTLQILEKTRDVIRATQGLDEKSCPAGEPPTPDRESDQAAERESLLARARSRCNKVDDIAGKLSVSRSTIYRWVKTGKPAAIALGLRQIAAGKLRG